MECRHYPALQEKIFWHTLENGLTVALVPRPGFARKTAYFVTDFGAIHRQFTVDGTPCQVPAGVAHFLEHKLFDMPDGDVTEGFAALGAVPNAFTSYDMTAYYFSCTENFEACLVQLLDFVTTPYFTQQSVDKEQGIIGQEIDMNVDSPDTRVFENLVKAMYQSHPISVPILGDRQSIAQITPQVLQLCHRAFYRPENMLLCVVGDVDPAQVVALAEKKVGKFSNPSVEADMDWQEAMTCLRSDVQDSMEVAMPMFQLGFKCEPPDKGEAAVRQEAIGDLAAEALFGESSPLYLRLYEQGLIDSSFGGGFETVDGMAMLTAFGDSEDAPAVRAAILEEAVRIVREGLPQADFQRMKRSALGRRIRGLDSLSAVAFRVCAYHFSGFDYFRFPEIYRTIAAEDICEFLGRVVQKDRCCLSVILPLEQEDENCESE